MTISYVAKSKEKNRKKKATLILLIILREWGKEENSQLRSGVHDGGETMELRMDW